ncbi:MAG: YceH family protein [Pseudomonadota bacterium]
MSQLPELDAIEARIIGCLIEKSVVTPDQYPLTLNALTNACNQKTSRDPVMSLSAGEVQGGLRRLTDKHLVMVDENFRGRAEKYTQRFCDTRYSELQFDSAERAIVTLLMLRGPQTPGELKSRSGRLHAFPGPNEVEAAMNALMQRDAGPLVVRLPRRAGRRDNEYMHLFSGEVDGSTEPAAVTTPAAADPKTAEDSATLAELTRRLEQLEATVAELVASQGRDLT